MRIYEEARGLIARGHEVTIATYSLGREMEGVPTIRIPAVPWYRKLEAGPSWHKPYLDALLFFRALSAGRGLRPDVIHAHLHEGAFIGLLLGRLLGVPVLFDCQGSLTREMIDHGFIRAGSFFHRMFRSLERLVNDGAGQIVTSSGAGRDELIASWGMAEGKVTAVIDGVDTEVFRPFPREEAKIALGMESDRPTVVFLGLLNSYQGVDILLEAAAIMAKGENPPCFLIMGYPDDGYRRKAEELGIAGSVAFTGRIDYALAPLYLCAGDIAVSPKLSATEANGKLLNYMACGLPIVASDTAVNREILGDGAVYARPGDAEELAVRIGELLADPAKRERLASESRKRATELHSWGSRIEGLCAVYRKLLQSAGP